jgi:hypothetical protein
MDVFISGQIQPQTHPANEPYYSTVPEYNHSPEAGQSGGSDTDSVI